MSAQAFIKFILVAGSALLFIWAGADQKAQAKVDARLTFLSGAADNRVYQSSDRDSARVGYTPEITFTPAFTSFLPVIFNPPPGIFGGITYQGEPVAGITLTLQLWEAGSFVAVLTTTTQADGSYLFLDVPGLEAGQGKSYVVRYMNNGDTRFLAYWYSDFLNSYIPDTRAAGGNFDIANIVLTSPPNGAIVALPHTFHWTPRPTTPSDNYHVMLACRSTGNRSYFEQGYTGSFQLGHLPQACNDYWWLVTVTPQGLIMGGTGGASYEYRAVSFSITGHEMAIQSSSKLVDVDRPTWRAAATKTLEVFTDRPAAADSRSMCPASDARLREPPRPGNGSG